MEMKKLMKEMREPDRDVITIHELDGSTRTGRSWSFRNGEYPELPEEIMDGAVMRSASHPDGTMEIDVAPDRKDTATDGWFGEFIHALPAGPDGPGLIRAGRNEILCRTGEVAAAVSDLLYALYDRDGYDGCIITGQHETGGTDAGWHYIALVR